MPAERPLRMGLIGAGFMGAVHSRAVRAAGGRLHAVAASSPERSALAARELGFAEARSAEELLADPDVDVVHVCTPNATHQRFAAAAVDAGKHVVCEKPLAVDLTAARELADAADEAGIVTAVPFVYRFHPMVREARARVRRGDIGDLTLVVGSYLQDWLLEASDDDWRVDRAAGGASRAFGDIGSHLVDVVEFVSGRRIVSLQAVTSTVHPIRSGRAVHTEDIAMVLVRFDGDAVGTLTVSQVSAGHGNDLRFELTGTRASVSFAQETPDTLTIGRRGSREIIDRGASPSGPDAERLSLVPQGHPMGYQDAFNAFVRDAYATIDGRPREGMPTFGDGARAAAVTDAVMRSARSGERVAVPAASRSESRALRPV